MSACSNMMTESEKPLVIAIIPARGGSKGVPRKNVKNLCGKPLIAYTIEVAKAVSLIDYVVVSTEDTEIAEISKSFGAFVPFLRPKDLAQDDSNLSHVMDHMHFGLKERIPFTRKYILIAMFVTSPFRNVDTIHGLVEKTILGFNVKTAKKINKTGWYYSMAKSDNRLCPLNGSNLHMNDGDRSFYRSYGSFLSCTWNYPEKSPLYHHIIENPIELIDIDNYKDFFLAQEVIHNRMYDFGLQPI